MLLYPLVVTELALRLVLDVIVDCFPAKEVATSPVPVIVTFAAATDATVNAVLEVSTACFPFAAAARVPVIPATVTVEFKKATPSACSSRLATISRPRMSPLAVTPALQVTLVTDSCEVELIEAPAFAEINDVMSVPFRYNGPAKTRLDEMVAEPLISIDGAVTGHENTAVLPSPSRSTLFESAKLNVPDAGFIRAQVS